MAKSGGVERGGSISGAAAIVGQRVAGSGTDEARKMQALEDLIVQTEIFLQYSLQAKAMERLQKIAAMFPGEEERNARLQNLYQTGELVAAGTRQKQNREPAPAAPPPPAPVPCRRRSHELVSAARE